MNEILKANELIWDYLYGGVETNDHQKKNALRFKRKLKKLRLY